MGIFVVGFLIGTMKWFLLGLAFLAMVSTLTAKECKDINEAYCQARKANCDKFIDFMKKYCPKTCGFCHVGPTVPTTPGPTYPPYHGKCGQPEVKGVRVIAGTTPPRGAWPWQILLLFKGKATCGGTLIAPGWVVTAAHRVYRRDQIPSNFAVRVGEHDRTKHEGSEVEVEVEKVIRHPSYSPYTLNNDISLLKLKRPVQLNKY